MADLWYPSTVVNIRLRFDETFKVSETPEPGVQGGDETDQVDPTAKPVLRPLITQTGTDNLSFVMNRVPKSAQVELPGYRQAGKFSLEFDWRELPIDPRLIRSAAVEIFMGAVSASDFASGMTTVGPDGRRRSILNVQTETGMPRDDLMVIAGNVDSWVCTHSGDGSTVKMDGRDFRGTFLDSPANPAMMAALNLNQPITEVVVDILKGHPAAQYMKIKYIPQDWPQGMPPPVADTQGLTRVRRKADGEGTSTGGGAEGVNIWDLITKYCFLVGAIPYFRGRDIIIRPAASVFDPSKPKAGAKDQVFDPKVRLDDEGRPFEERKMVFGRNIRELTFERKLSGVKVPVVEVVSFDTSSTERGARKMLIEQWPPADEKLARISGVSPSGEVAQTDKLQISVPGVRDRERLLGVARALYEEIGRGELGGSCRTAQLSSFKGSNDDPDLMRLRPGDPVEFLTDVRAMTSNAPGASTFVDSKRKSFAEAVKDVKESLSGKTGVGDENLARVLVASSRSTIIDLLRTFRTANVVFNWSTAAGIQIAFDFQNYFVVRHGINEQLGKNVIPPVEKVVASTRARKPKTKEKAKPVLKSLTPGEKSSLTKVDEKGFYENSAGGSEFF
jgi:hypothetical protein